MKTLKLLIFIRVKSTDKVTDTPAASISKATEDIEKESPTAKRIQAYCDCPLHPLK
ncbi:hypothetical protein JMN32_19580 [Fulvivirga sp. 29W222]|uniref:Uncharacterized protein n=1 Tax=Fulvivirga marina TaxID=2494733 RepID=A0A937G1L7_9BACT|nr:hypothetical protein [Fulvivirga marina]MBL6448521.1 hypothetical protein [Fulvivirga marina]